MKIFTNSLVIFLYQSASLSYACKNAAAKQRERRSAKRLYWAIAPDRVPGASWGKAGVCNLSEAGRRLYTLADVEVAGPFHIWLESGSRVLIGLFGLVSVFDWPGSWRLRVHQSAWQRAVDWWMSVPGIYPGLSGEGFSVSIFRLALSRLQSA